MTVVRFLPPEFIKNTNLKYSVIATRYKGKWILVRHNDRFTWEIPGGHIEPDEDPDYTASRELKEETGAEKFRVDFVTVYSVEKDGMTGYGKLYFAEVDELGTIPDTSEIAEISFFETLPGNLTYPDIQPLLFERVITFLTKNPPRTPPGRGAI